MIFRVKSFFSIISIFVFYKANYTRIFL